MRKILFSFATAMLAVILCVSIFATGTTTLYAPDGRTLVKPDSEVELYKSLGWYTYPVTKMYSLDGRTLVCATANVENNKKVGWYTEPVTKMYSADGRTIICKTANVEANKKVGWFTQPVTLMYAYNGKTAYLPTANIESNLKVGWYLNRSDVYTTMYAMNGKTVECLKMNVAANQKVGWYLLGDYVCKLVDKNLASGSTTSYPDSFDLLNKHLSELEKTDNYESNADYIKISAKMKELCTAWTGGTNMPFIFGGVSENSTATATVVSLVVYNITDKALTGFNVSIGADNANGDRTTFAAAADSSIVNIAPYKSAVYEIQLPGVYSIESQYVYATGATYADGTTVGQ
ncbi:MAG: hypothetical protein IJA60_06005 [Clostridia bacterium]|nr:hypothetical protein [Clostridia bacterium]